MIIETFFHRGLPCVIRELPGLGALAGYVGVPVDHPHHGSSSEAVDAGVHGGITWADKHLPRELDEAGPAIPPASWWLGFDCAHHGDSISGLRASGTARDADYVRRDLHALADFLAEAAQ